MSLGGNDFFGIEKSGDNDEKCNFFTETDVNTITGKNLVLNYLARIELEIRAVGYTEAVVEVAQFFDNFCTKSGKKIADFYLNPVIKMILEKIEEMPRVKAFLNERVFDDIKEMYRQECENTFSCNEEIETKIHTQEQEHIKNQVLKEREIKKIAKEKNISFEEALKLEKQNKQDEEEKRKLLNLLHNLPPFMLPDTKDCISLDLSNILPSKQRNKKSKNKNQNKDKTKYISLDDDIQNDDTNQDDITNFWDL